MCYCKWSLLLVCLPHRLIGQVVKASASKTEGPEFESHLRWDLSRLSHTNDLKISTPVATLPGSWHFRVSPGTGRPGVSILCLGEVEFDLQLLYKCGSM